MEKEIVYDYWNTNICECEDETIPTFNVDTRDLLGEGEELPQWRETEYCRGCKKPIGLSFIMQKKQ